MYKPLEVLKSAAGYYIGRIYIDDDEDFGGPGTRESEYFPTKEEAIAAVRNGFKLRHCEENDRLYVFGSIDTCPGDFYQDENFYYE